jgi:formate hydrogenlyase subunit 6/NADH:ubiquinone oxidoreductase subunit I
MGKGIAHVNYQGCMACGVCVVACPFSYLELSKIDVDSLHKAYPELITDHQCTGCGLCAAACPVEAIHVE